MPPTTAAPTQQDLIDELFHDLSQPLTGLQCAWEVASLKPRTGEECRTLCEQSLIQLENVQWLIAGVRQLSKASALAKPGPPISLSTLLGDQIDDLQLLADSRSINISNATDGGPCMVSAAANDIHRLLSLLLITLLEIADSSSTIAIDLRNEESQAKLRISIALSPPFADLPLQNRLNFAITEAIALSVNGTFALPQEGLQKNENRELGCASLTIEIILPLAS